MTETLIYVGIHVQDCEMDSSDDSLDEDLLALWIIRRRRKRRAERRFRVHPLWKRRRHQGRMSILNFLVKYLYVLNGL